MIVVEPGEGHRTQCNVCGSLGAIGVSPKDAEGDSAANGWAIMRNVHVCPPCGGEESK